MNTSRMLVNVNVLFQQRYDCLWQHVAAVCVPSLHLGAHPHRDLSIPAGTVSKTIGQNAVYVLGTLFLLSYAKLLPTVIAAVISISLEDEDRKSHLLWRMDANVPYFSALHAILFFIALLAVLFYILPLTLPTLLAPCLRARTNHRI